MIHFIAAGILSMAKPVQADKAQIESTDHIRILPVQRTPESNTIILVIAVPKTEEMKESNPVWIQCRLDGYPIGAGSQFDRANEIAVSKKGQTLHVIIDNQPYFTINEPAIDPFNEDGYFYDTRYKFEIPYTLKSGRHTIRIFPARSYGESLKGENTFQATSFYVGSNSGGVDADLNKPYLTYNEPGDQIPLKESQPVLLDFYIRNCELTADGYKVILTIDGNIHRTLTSWQPYYIYGLKSGKHTIQLQLVNSKGTQVPGEFNNIQRTIYIQK